MATVLSMPPWIMAIWFGSDMKDGAMVASNGLILKRGRSVQVGVLNNCFLIDVEKPFPTAKGFLIDATLHFTALPLSIF